LGRAVNHSLRFEREEASGFLFVTFSQAVERDYESRGAFPHLRLEQANRRQGTGGVYHVGLDEAREILADAEQRREADDLPRGTVKALSCLVGNLRLAIQREDRRGVWDDPGREEVLARQQQAGAQFQIGEAAQRRDGSLVEIVGAYGVYTVRDSAGQYLSQDGVRISYLWGYRVKAPGEQPHFAAPHQLRRKDGSPRHLQLVAVA